VNSYPTLAECQKANIPLDPSKEEFETWYAPAAFRATNSEPMQNRNLPVIYGGNANQNILNKVLIAHHLNPNATLADLSRRTEQLNLDVPNMPRYHPASRRPALSTDSTRVNAQP